MKKIIICILLALALASVDGARLAKTLVQAGISRYLSDGEGTQAQATPQPTAGEQLGVTQAHDMLDVTLYFRCGDSALLGAQHAQLDIRREETIAASIVARLLEGPQAGAGELSGLFPKGTRLISVSGEGTTAFVTLSREFLGKPDGAPGDWEDLTIWQEEAALRRMLAVQSLVLSLTEDGRYQRVQLYLAQSDDDVPQRIPMAYFSTDAAEPNAVLAACSRDETYLLTPQRVLNRLLDRWQKKDWAAVYELLASGDEALPMLSAFESKMRALDVSLLTYETTTGSVSFDGQRATLVLSAQIHTPDGGDAKLTRESVPLVRGSGSWAMTYDTLLSLMIRD